VYHAIIDGEVFTVQKSKLIEWFSEGSIAIPKLLIHHYAKLGLNEEEFVLLLHVYTYSESGNKFPTPDELAKKMSFSSTSCTELLRSLMKKGFLSIKEVDDMEGILGESYSLQPLWKKLSYFLLEADKNKQSKQDSELEAKLYSLFENEFGRPLSPMESESLTMWIDEDHHDPVLIKAALREAVMSGKLNFRYIDRILFEWKKNGIKTVEQAAKHSQRFRKSRNQSNSSKEQSGEDKISIPFYNWLDS
jgi:DNA replication protein